MIHQAIRIYKIAQFLKYNRRSGFPVLGDVVTVIGNVTNVTVPPYSDLSASNVVPATTFIVVCVLSAVFNIGHGVALTQIPFRRRHGGPHVRILFQWLAALNCLLVLDYLLTSNEMAQQILRAHKPVCALSSMIAHVCIMAETHLKLYFVCDRLHYLTAVPAQRYWRSFGVRYASQIIACLVFSPVIFVSAAGFSNYDRAFSVKGFGACQLDSPELPQQTLPGISYFLLLSLANFGLTAFLVCYGRRRRNHQQASARLARISVCWCVLGVYGWTAIILMVFVRFRGGRCEGCEWYGLIQYAIVSGCTPLIIIACNAPHYRIYAQRLRNGRGVQSELSQPSRDTEGRGSVNMAIVNKILERTFQS